ncbi:basic proline-rich protein-like [Mustela putorius furo]|uniref:Basic proline-rich protein-like n=1 Tax=Mustela putorius furo TaxID=9669 RepID=A0A8U0S1Z1_MUSPF|nr:basic proline-rich protein-like [Mustela putorius furo]
MNTPGVWKKSLENFSRRAEKALSPARGGSRGTGWSLQPGKGSPGSGVGRGRGGQGRSTFNGQELAKSCKIAECSPPTPSGVAGARTRAPRKEGNPQFGPKRKLSGPRLHLTPHRPSTPPHARQAARPAPAWPPGAQRRINKFNYYRNRGGWGRLRETRARGRKGAHSPLLGPDAPVPATRACRPAGSLPARRTIRPRSAAVPPGGPGGAGGARGGPGCWGRARQPRGPPARGLAGCPPPPPPNPKRPPRPTPPPRPAQAALLSRLGPRPDPRPPARQPPPPVGAPRAPRPPAPAAPAPAPLTLSFSARGLTRAGESPASHQSERRWQWTRKLGCRCYCSPLGSGESLSLSSKRAKKAGLPGLHRRGSSLLQHHYRHCEDITPESRSSALRNDNFPTILEAEERGAGGKSAPAPDKVQISTSHLWKKVHTGRLHRRLGEKAGKKLGVLEKRFHGHHGAKCFCIF